jgi:predicted DNA-binding protein
VYLCGSVADEYIGSYTIHRSEVSLDRCTDYGLRMESKTKAQQKKQLAYVSARLTEGERVRLDALATATDRTPSAIVRRALRAYINHLDEVEAILTASTLAGRKGSG